MCFYNDIVHCMLTFLSGKKSFIIKCRCKYMLRDDSDDDGESGTSRGGVSFVFSLPFSFIAFYRVQSCAEFSQSICPVRCSGIPRYARTPRGFDGYSEIFCVRNCCCFRCGGPCRTPVEASGRWRTSDLYGSELRACVAVFVLVCPAYRPFAGKFRVSQVRRSNCLV